MKTTDTHLISDDGCPFFWLADTAWNAPLRGTERAWREYLETRAQQGFTVIQFVTTQWRGCMAPIHGPLYTVSGGEIHLNMTSLTAMDRWIDLIHQYGLVAAPVMLWANTPTCPGQELSESNAIHLGRAMVDRWQGPNTVWLLAGDGNYEGRDTSERWKRIGRGIFHDRPDAITTLHPCGGSWVGSLFADEPWYTFTGIQSGHGDSDEDLRWLLEGPYSTAWRQLRRPSINLEPNYEFAYAYGKQHRFTSYHIRRAAYWSLLSAPPAGITYGNNSIWIWAQADGETAEGHSDTWVANHWQQGLVTEGVDSMTTLRDVFEQLPWTRLRPAQELLAAQPGTADPRAFIAIAATRKRDCLVAFLPQGGKVMLHDNVIEEATSACWIDPRTGNQHAIDTPVHTLTAPDDEDWLLVVTQTPD